MGLTAKVMQSALGLCLIGLLSQPAPVAAGGWGVTTIDDMPQTLVAGEPITLTFSVRQHGVHLMEGLAPTFVFSNGKDHLEVTAAPQGKNKGQYTLQVKLPTAGEWRWEMTSFPSQAMAPLTVIDKSQRLRALRLARLSINTTPGQIALGKALFLSKGCYICHMHAEVYKSGQFQNSYPFGSAPNLTQRGLSAEYLQIWLKDPAAVKPQTTMPNLKLKGSEIRALAAFLTAKNAGIAKASP